MLTLKDATIDDLTIVRAWLRNAADCVDWAGERVRYPVDLSTLATDIQWAVARSFALCSSEDLVGFGQIVGKAVGRRHLARLIVDPAMRGHGAGRELAVRLLETARQDGGGAVSLNVRRDNAPAISLYTSLGFVEVDRPANEAPSSSIYMEGREP